MNKELEDLGFKSDRCFENTEDAATRYVGRIKECKFSCVIGDDDPDTALLIVTKNDKLLLADTLPVVDLLKGLNAMKDED